MNLLTDAFYWISTGLMVPVMVLLLIGFIYSLINIGGFYGYFSDRKKFKSKITDTIESTDSVCVSDLEFNSIVVHHPRFLKALKLAQSHGWKDIYIQKAMTDYEVSSQKQLDSLKTLMRTGPMLGLMGTLIPMGPALVGLATGNIASMAMNMQVAFSTTVIGVFLGGVGFVLHSVRKRWLSEDFYQLQYLMDLAHEESNSK